MIVSNTDRKNVARLTLILFVSRQKLIKIDVKEFLTVINGS